MVSHSEFANGKLMGPQGAINATQHWTDLSNRLNELGPEKTMEQWKKVWRDLKRNTRGRAAAINAAHRQTGNPDIEDKLSNLDNKVIAVIGWESSTGIPGLSAIGLATNEHLKAVTDAFIKIAEATNALTIVAQVNSQSNERMASAIERMAASNETMAAAISQLAETIGKK
uniref:Regulatory protein zeste n=1 Tax=Timema monikensis TaxID=170555 RepID=A0A7R9EKG6_9NEOP|nr:unnamed protein product [Timema monikensis]